MRTERVVYQKTHAHASLIDEIPWDARFDQQARAVRFVRTLIGVLAYSKKQKAAGWDTGGLQSVA